MSGILARIKKQEATGGKKLFAVVCGPRLGGKTTLAGTLPGKTLLLQAAVLESGCESAKALAAELQHDLSVLSFASLDELDEIIGELGKDETFDNVYIDGLSAISDMKYKDPKLQALRKKDGFGAFRELGEVVTEAIESLKRLTYASEAKKPKNVFITVALRVEHSGGNTDVKLEVKGQMAVTAITKLGESVVTVLPPLKTETGETGHRMITKSEECWPGRIDGLLSNQNPGVIEPADLGKLLSMCGAA